MKVIFSITAMFVCLAAHAEAADRQLAGTIKTLDVNQGSITLLTGSGNTLKEQSFSLAAKDIPVSDDLGNKLKLDGLRANATVRVTLSSEDDVVSILLELPRRVAHLTKVDVERGMITTRAFEDTKEFSYLIARDAKVYLFQQPCKLGDLREGLSAELVLSLDLSSVLSLNACFVKDGDAHGAIVHVDEIRHTLGLFAGRTGRFNVVNYAVDKDFYFLYREEPRKLTLAELPRCRDFLDLPKATPVYLRLTPDRKNVLLVAAYAPQLRGVLRDIDAEQHSIVFEYVGGRRESFAVSRAAKIEVRGQRSQLANLTSGMPARLFLSMDGTEVTSVDATENDGN